MKFSERATTCIKGIFKVLETGRRIDRAFIVRRFEEAHNICCLTVPYPYRTAIAATDDILALQVSTMKGSSCISEERQVDLGS